MARIYVSLDLETTGLDPEHDAIIEVGAVKFRDEEVLERWSTLVRPERRIPYRIRRLTGIEQEEADRGPSVSSVVGRLANFVRDYPLVGHNIIFDLSFLRQRGLLLTNQTVDTFELAGILVPHASRYSLTRLAEELGIPSNGAHRALADAETARRLFLSLVDRASGLDADTLEEINRLARNSNWSLRPLFLHLQRQKGRAAFTGTIREQLAAKGVIAEDAPGPIFAPLLDRRPLEPSAEPEKLDLAALSEMFENDGLIARSFADYEYRPQQVEMMLRIGEAFNEGEHLLVEAGTGTGKSLAYLLPAAAYAVTNGRHVVISTNTINLQDQLFLKDIPDLQSVLPFESEAVLLKGRSNYLCLRRLSGLRRKLDLSVDEIRVLAKILVWLPGTTTGDRSELNLMRDENLIWSSLSAEDESCNPELCSYIGPCFFYRARRQAEEAHLIVINHSLLVSDMITDNRVLPRYQHLIIDEAHHVEDVATRQLSFQVSQGRMLALLSSLSHSTGRKPSGLLSEVPRHLRGSEIPSRVLRELDQYLSQAIDDIERARRQVHNFFTALSLFLDEYRRPESAYDQRVRLTSGLRVQPAWSDVEITWAELAGALGSVEGRLEYLYRGLGGVDDSGIEDYEDLLQELLGRLRQIKQLRQETEAIIAEPMEEGIYWANISAHDQSVVLHAAPLHIGTELEQRLYTDKDCLILTSATLSTGQDFDHIRERLSLWAADELAIGSPFDYEGSTLLFVPTDIPEPGQSYYQKSVEQALAELGLATEGRTIVLFTSHSQLRSTYRAISRPLGDEGIAVLGQGIDGSRYNLLNDLRTNPRTVVLGTRSYWEGIDVVGDALSCLVIARLPFPVPDDPIFAARSETFEDPFSQYAVPQAILRFRQGFGRLIRSKTDRGVVVLLDKRVLTKFYGSAFLEAIPKCTFRQGSIHDLPELAGRWLTQQGLGRAGPASDLQQTRALEEQRTPERGRSNVSSG
jgi:predicted DnaQ family exonuclease/DinG family helicase